MAKRSFFGQEGFHGGIPSGIAVDEQTVLHAFHERSPECNPARIWYADTVAKGDQFPSTANESRAWIGRRADPIQEALPDIHGDLHIGLDEDRRWPYQRSARRLPEVVRVAGHASGVTRWGEGKLAERVGTHAKGWHHALCFHGTRHREAVD